jgi:uncharacterized protein involved in exopolysaccharide biosynthesis
MSNVSRLDDPNDDGSPGILLSRQMRMMPVQYLPGPTNATAVEPDDITVLMQYLQVIWKHKWIVVAGAILGILTGLGISLSMTPMYRASTTLEIQDFQEPMRVNAVVAADPNLGTQVQLLSSQTMRQRVGEIMDANPATFPRINDPLASLRRFVGLADPAKSVKWSDAVWVAAMNLRITQGKDSRILLIESQSTHPRAAADFTNTLAQEYISRNKEERWEAYKSTGEWLTRAQDELKHKLEQSERRLQDFARNNGLIITGSQNAAEEKLKQLQMERPMNPASPVLPKLFRKSSITVRWPNTRFSFQT